MRAYEPFYLEDLHPGLVIESARRTLTETDLVTFAMLTSDWNPVHTDAVAARAAGFERPLVHGALALCLATGLIQRTGIFEGSAVALLGLDAWTFDAPLFVGDTVHARLQVLSTRRTSRGDRGVVRRQITLVNHDDVGVCSGSSDFMVLARDTDPNPAREDT